MYKLPELGGRGGEVIWVMSVRNIFWEVFPNNADIASCITLSAKWSFNQILGRLQWGNFSSGNGVLYFALFTNTFFSNFVNIFFSNFFLPNLWKTAMGGLLLHQIQWGAIHCFACKYFFTTFFIPICQHFYSKCSFCNRPGNVELKGFSWYGFNCIHRIAINCGTPFILYQMHFSHLYKVLNRNHSLVKGSPFLKRVVSIWASPERGVGVKACQDGLEHFFPTFARGVERLARMEQTHFKKGFP